MATQAPPRPIRPAGHRHARSSAQARLQGGLARASGEDLERTLRSVHAWYDRAGEALMEKVSLPIEGWGRTLRVAGRATVDFTGHAVIGGERVPVAFDAKRVTGRASYQVAPEDWHQLEYLRNAKRRHGVRAFYLLHCTDLQTLWILEDLEALYRREPVPIRTVPRKSKANPRPTPVHHLPHLTAPQSLAATLHLVTRRPHWDYLRLLDSHARDTP